MREYWYDIKGFEGIYQISIDGRIRKYTGKILTCYSVSNKGYLRIRLTDANGHRKWYSYHRLIAMSILYDTWFEGADVDHIDSNKLNNAIQNLRWVTKSENMQNYELRRRGIKK